MSDHESAPSYANRVLSYLTATSVLPDEASVWKFIKAALESMPKIEAVNFEFETDQITPTNASNKLIQTIINVRHNQTAYADLYLQSEKPLDTEFLDVLRSTANLLALEVSRRRLQSDMEERVLDSTRELAQLNSRYQIAIRTSGVGVWEWHPDSDELIWDDRMLDIYEVTRADFTHKNAYWESFVLPEDKTETENLTNRAVETGIDFVTQFRIKTKSGIKHIQASAKYVPADQNRSEYFLGTNYDSTEIWQLNEQLRQTQRLESLGQLTGGIAHDFNNILSTVMGSAEILQLLAKQNDDRELSRLSKDVIEATEKGKSLTSRLLAFARKDQLDPKVLNISEVIDHLTILLSRTLSDDVRLVTDLDSAPLPVNIDSHQLENCLLNLVINARDAMPDGGKISISTQLRRLEESELPSNSEIQAGSYALITIEDEGIGIAASDIDKVIEPFYTTKSQDQGTGLGLSMVHGFITQSGGHLEIKSAINKGTQISVLLPTTIEIQHAKEPVEKQKKPSDDKFDGTTLLLEDDDAVADISSTFLQTLGFKVLRAATGQEALSLFTAHQQEITILLTDISLPGNLNGLQVAEQIKTLQPDIVTIFASGYPQAFKESSENLQTNKNFLQKPYRLKALRDVIAQNLVLTNELSES